MHGAFESFRDCGWSAWLCLLVGAAGMAVGVIGLVLLATSARRFAWLAGTLALLLGLGALCVGFLGRQWGLAKTEEVLSDPDLGLDPSQVARIREQGTLESNQCIKVGTATGALPFVMGAIAVGIGLALRKKQPA